MNFEKTILIKIVKKLYNIITNIVPRKTASEKEYINENKKDKKENLYANSITDLAIKEFKKNKGTFGGFSLAESSVRCFLHNLFQQKQTSYHICEFGGGQSTMFWNILSKYVDLTITTYEHDPDWAQHLTEQINNNKIKINSCELMQINEENRIKMFLNPTQSKNIWESARTKIDKEQIKNPILTNGFYNIAEDQFPTKKIDAIVLDGPHGNGRSIFFPLFYDYINKGTLVLLDDYHHYPFLEDLNKLFKFEILEERKYNHSNKGWVTLKIIEKIAIN